jgi:hypothetical protein
MWANEQEAAVLSGGNYETFRSKIHRWEAQVFPPVSTENGSGLKARIGLLTKEDAGLIAYSRKDQRVLPAIFGEPIALREWR